MLTACVTGHRRLGEPEQVSRLLAAALDLALAEGYTVWYTGMALGADQMAAELLLGKARRLVAVIPCDGYDHVWPAPLRGRYRSLLARADEVVVHPGGPYAPWKPHARNRWMVDRSQHGGSRVGRQVRGRHVRDGGVRPRPGCSRAGRFAGEAELRPRAARTRGSQRSAGRFGAGVEVQGRMDRAEAGRVRAMLGDLYAKIIRLSRKAELLDDVHRKLAALDPDRALALLMRSEEFNQEAKETVLLGCFALALWGYCCPYLVLDPCRPWTGRCPACGGAVPKPALEKLAGEEG